MDAAASALNSLHPAVRAWFARSFAAPSPPQASGWPAIAAGENVLLLAPTGSGKTFAAFLACLSRLYEEADAGDPLDGIRILYVSPLKALNNDIHRNLEEPLAGIAAEAARLGLPLPPLRASIRTGDTPPGERRAMLRRPPQILITTPESLFLMLSSRARELFQQVETVIIDEIHALFPSKRGTHLAISLEHLQSLNRRPLQRLGLSATVRPPAEVASFLGGGSLQEGAWRSRPVSVIDTGQRKQLDLRLILPVPDLRDLPEKSVWPPIYRQILDLVKQHRSTLVFVNNRRVAERVTASLNDLAGEMIAYTHHGSLAKEKRLEAEDLLKRGELACLVATSSLELGIDVGAIDLVVQVESPMEVARGLQRVGRAGHLLNRPSKGRIIPKTRGDLLEAAAIAREMRTGLVEEARAPENCLDVLAQGIVGLTAQAGLDTDRLFALIRGAYPYRRLPRAQFDGVLAMLSGEYGEEGFLAMPPRLDWNRQAGLVSATERGRRLAFSSGGTIPDRGYFGVYLAGSNVRLGELDEEFVAERRLGDRFVLGTSAWRVEELRRDRVIVSPSRHGEAMIPFWKGEIAGRSFELGGRIGGFLRLLEQKIAEDESAFNAFVETECLGGPEVAANLRAYLQAQLSATGVLPHDRRLLLEEFQDELGEWRIMLHCPYGGRVNNPLALLLKEQIRANSGLELESICDDNGILLVAPGATDPPPLDLTALPVADLEAALAGEVRGSTLFATLFRQNAARALMLPRGAPGRQRTPLWLNRLRAADLLQLVSAYPDFPLVLETFRDCLQGSFDLAGLRRILTGLREGGIELAYRRTKRPSPFAQSLQFNLFGIYMYVPDLPKGERRFRSLGLNREALRELLGSEEIRGLLDQASIEAVAAEAGGLTGRSRPRDAAEFHLWLHHGHELDPDRLPPPATEDELPWEAWLNKLKTEARVAELEWRGGAGPQHAWVAAEDVPVYLGALPGCLLLWPQTPPPLRVPGHEEARQRLIRRYSLTHGPFTLQALQSRYGFAGEEAAVALAALAAAGQVQEGEFSPEAARTEWCDVDLLQRIHRRSLDKARREIEPRSPAAYAEFLQRWQAIGAGCSLPEALDLFRGLWLPARLWHSALSLRVPGYREAQLDKLLAGGEYRWAASGFGDNLKLCFGSPGAWLPEPPISALGQPVPERAATIARLLQAKGALFLSQIVAEAALGVSAALEALEWLVAAGSVTNDTLGPIRFFGARRPPALRYQLTRTVLSEMGRWSMVDRGSAPAAADLAEILLRRYGLVTREIAARDGLGWEDLGPIYERWEALGKVRRGYFVDGMGGLQYARLEAVESLRQPGAGAPDCLALGWKDPANPYGSLLALPGNAGVIQPETLVLRHGEPVLIGGGKKLKLVSLAPPDPTPLRGALQALAAFYPGKLTIATLDGRPVLTTPAAEILQELGFEKGYREMTRWG